CDVHPRMDAALKASSHSMLESCSFGGSRRNENIIRTWRLWNKVSVDHPSTLRSRLGCPGSGIESRDETTSESLYPGKSVCLPAQVLQVNGCTLCCSEQRRDESPGTN